MENSQNKESYLHRKTDQLRQWERVIDRLVSRVDKADDGSKTKLQNRLTKILAKKANTEIVLKQLHDTGNEKWDNIRAVLEQNWLELREAFLETSEESG